MDDRTYWRLSTEDRSWHAQARHVYADEVIASCGYTARPWEITRADRLPPEGHFCGHCARVIAARTDVEDD